MGYDIRDLGNSEVYKYVRKIRSRGDKIRYVVNGFGKAGSFETEREAAIAADLALIERGKKPVNVLVPDDSKKKKNVNVKDFRIKHINSDEKKTTIEFNKWLFENDLVPNNSFLWFSSNATIKDVVFFELEELFDFFKRGEDIKLYLRKLKEVM